MTSANLFAGARGSSFSIDDLGFGAIVALALLEELPETGCFIPDLVEMPYNPKLERRKGTTLASTELRFSFTSTGEDSNSLSGSSAGRFPGFPYGLLSSGGLSGPALERATGVLELRGVRGGDMGAKVAEGGAELLGERAEM